MWGPSDRIFERERRLKFSGMGLIAKPSHTASICSGPFADERPARVLSLSRRSGGASHGENGRFPRGNFKGINVKILAQCSTEGRT
jgi:hypothetical protein